MLEELSNFEHAQQRFHHVTYPFLRGIISEYSAEYIGFQYGLEVFGVAYVAKVIGSLVVLGAADYLLFHMDAGSSPRFEEVLRHC